MSIKHLVKKIKLGAKMGLYRMEWFNAELGTFGIY